MSGGFFRGTSADQDTRFSNKQAKLLKSQKFAPELEHMVDMTKVKMDVIRPWIATRATELLGFEDEVLINFVYGLLDGKEVDGKQIQIQLTGFMEKNTGKFMKELWSLLLSAQNNVSGVPQQFLDAKEEETRKKKAETDRIAQEIQKRKEKDVRELEQEKQRRMDGEADISRSIKGASGAKHSMARVSSVQPEEEIEVDGRHGPRAENGSSESPHPTDHSPASYRSGPSATRSSNKSFSRSRSDSEEGHRPRSVSVSSQSQRPSVSPTRRYQSPMRQSRSPERRYRSPPRRSISPRLRRSPFNIRSPLRRTSPYSRRRRSPSPFRNRSPRARRRSPPYQHRRSPSPSRRRSPIKFRRNSPSPLRRRSPIRRRSPSPLRRRSPPPRSPRHQRRSPKINRSHSPSYRTRRSLSRERDSHIDGTEPRRYRDEHNPQRKRERRSPVYLFSDRELAERRDSGHKFSENVSRKVPISLRSPQRGSRSQSDTRNRVQQQEKTPSQAESPTHVRKLNSRISRRSRSLSKSPNRQTREEILSHDSPGTSRDEEQNSRAREAARHRADSSHKRSNDLLADVGLKRSYANDFSPEVYSPDRLVINQSAAASGRPVNLELRKKDNGQRSDTNLPERHVRERSYEEIEYGPGKVREEKGSLGNVHDGHQSAKKLLRDASLEKESKAVKRSCGDSYGISDEKQSRSKSDDYRESRHETELITKSMKKVDKKSLLDANGSDSKETETYQHQNMEKRRHKKSDKRKRDSDESSESDPQIDDRKEAKRRRKDEKRLRKEERRRRREERHRKRLERRASKLKVKSMDTVTPPSDFEKNHNDADDSDDHTGIGKNSHPSDADEAESEQKKLEIELRKKALESLRAKKAISH